MDRLTEMNCFVKTVDTGSFAAASKVLGMSPQMVGKQVSALEERLSSQLLIRTTRQQSLTEIGQAFYERCLVVLKAHEEAEALVSDSGPVPRGQLVISAPYTFGSYRLVPFVSRFLEAHPEIKVKLVLNDRNVDLVGEGFDAVIRIGELEDSSLIVRHLGSFRLVAAASPDYLKRRGTPKAPKELASHECLIFNYWHRPALTEWTFEKDGRAETVSVAGKFQVNDGRSVIAAAVAGYGVALQDENIIKTEVAAGRLIALLPDYVGPIRRLNLLYPKAKMMSPKLRTFIDALAGHLA